MSGWKGCWKRIEHRWRGIANGGMRMSLMWISERRPLEMASLLCQRRNRIQMPIFICNTMVDSQISSSHRPDTFE
ncbi:unnamed protein product [Gongylonema pulchrum]|uniref:Uncharacterized protein n=1 Tax=Gongylonema pulchrum TaxID=637853 RepID=A0A183F197_9BILA|nr:unnamed protein product [Gongylonema pulchrum]